MYILLLISLLLLIFRQKRSARIFIGIAGFWFLLITTPFIPEAMVRSLESRYHQPPDSVLKNLGGRSDIIVLGGGHTDDKNLSANNQLSLNALSRLVEGIRIHRIITGSRLILSGYAGKSEVPQAVLLYRTALALGIDSADMAIQTAPVNTGQEAEEYVKNFGTSQNLIIITSAVHMPRAMLLFKKAGVKPIASPCDFLLKSGTSNDFWRTIIKSGNIELMEASIHEYAGIIAAKAGI